MDVTAFLNSIQEAANEELHNNPGEPSLYRSKFTENINFVNDYLKTPGQESERKTYEEMLYRLYILWAEFETTHKQYKQAKTVYEEAVNIPICTKNELFWISYIHFYLDRKKYRQTNDIFDQAFQYLWSSYLLWDAFYKYRQDVDNYRNNLDTLKSETRQRLKSQYQFEPPKPDYADISDYRPLFSGLFRHNVPLPNEISVNVEKILPILRDKYCVGIITHLRELEEMKYHEIILRRLALESIIYYFYFYYLLAFHQNKLSNKKSEQASELRITTEDEKKIRAKHLFDLQVLEDEKKTAIRYFDLNIKNEIKMLRRKEQYILQCINMPDFYVSDTNSVINSQRQILKLIMITLNKKFSSTEI